MNDRELLELAAKAAGIEYWLVRFAPRSAHIEKLHTTVNGETVEWNPLADDGDALRLAVKLKMRVDIGGSVVVAFITDDAQHHEDFTDSHYSATRRAIVRAAAEIGKLK